MDKNYLDYEFHFVCPDCGHTYHGSKTNPDNTLTRYCSNCRKNWHESQDEERVFVSWKEVKDKIDQPITPVHAWTPNKPSESGWYWIYVLDWRGSNYVDCAWYSAERDAFDLSVSGPEYDPDYTAADVRQWLGPITPPEPPVEVGNGN